MHIDSAVTARITRAIHFEEPDRVPIWDSLQNAAVYDHFASRYRLAPVVQCCENVAYKTGLMISREMLQRHFFPRLKRVIAPLKAAGIKVIWHSDHRTTALFSDRAPGPDRSPAAGRCGCRAGLGP